MLFVTILSHGGLEGKCSPKRFHDLSLVAIACENRKIGALGDCLSGIHVRRRYADLLRFVTGSPPHPVLLPQSCLGEIATRVCHIRKRIWRGRRDAWKILSP